MRDAAGSHLRAKARMLFKPHLSTDPRSNNINQYKPARYKLPRIIPTSEERDSYYRVATARIAEKIQAPSEQKLKTLPVYTALPAIILALQKHDIVAVNSATGSGKTLLTPKALIDAGFNRVFCMEPTQVATVSAAETVAKIWGTELGQEIGYCHGYAKSVSAESKVIYATNGYQLAYDGAHGFKYQKGDVIIFDEAHRPSVAMEFQLALLQDLREKAKKDSSIIVPKILIMSATLDLDEYSGFFRKKIPQIRVEGRSHPITVLEKDTPLVKEVVYWLKQGKSVMAFLPGVREINSVMEAVKKSITAQNLSAEIFPLHSKLLPHEQHAAIESTNLKFVAASNVAQESLTVKGLEVVVESGLIRRKVLLNGVPSLVTVPYSQFDTKQQDGRGGRERPGIAVRLGKVPYSCLDKSPTPAILSSEFAGDLLKILASSYSPGPDGIRRLQFLHRISNVRWEEEFKRLRDLGLLGPRNHITPHGRRASALPLDVSLAKMVVMAQDFALKNQNINILRKVIDVVSVIQTNGIVLPKSKHLWEQLAEADPRSEPLTEATLFHKALGRSNVELKECGIWAAQFKRAQRLQEDLYRRLNLNIAPGDEIILKANKHPTTMISDEQCVFESIWSGMANSVYRLQKNSRKKNPTYRAFTNGLDRQERTAHHFSLDNAPELIVGFPFTFIDTFSTEKPKEIHALATVSAISPQWLQKHFKDRQIDVGRKDKALTNLTSVERVNRAREEEDFFLPPLEKQERILRNKKKKRALKGAKGFVQHKTGKHREY